ncbi:MAG: TonB-dependent receptor, partial [Acidobacterium ailaaui]|nr:TonB-dependent receptor [Pseudacidobacterium ailaaui]
IGYERQEIPIAGRTTINVQLHSTAMGLNQIVVVGYGTQKKKDITGAVASIREEDFNKGIVTSPEQLLQGKISGVLVVQNSGEPGGGMSISIRGASSINAGTQPLFVIDGLPMDDAPVINGTGTIEFTPTRSPSNPLRMLNPADIASIEVLKDASATAIYGARGANGVIIITTKQGVIGKITTNYDVHTGIQNIAHKIRLLNAQEYKNILNQLISEGAATKDNEVKDIQGNGTDWQSEIFNKNALIFNHDLTFSGGDKTIKFYTSFNVFNQEGLIKNTSFKRYTNRINITFNPINKLEIGLNLNGSYGKNNYVPIGFGINGEADVIYDALFFDPTLPVKDTNGEYTTSPFLDLDNPVASIYGKRAIENTYRLFGTVYGRYNILSNLYFKLNIGGDFANARKDVYVSRLTRHGLPAGGIGSILQGNRGNYLIESTLNYNKVAGNNEINAVIGATTQRFINTSSNISASGFPSDALTTNNIGAGEQYTYVIGSNKNSNKLLSYIGRINYSFKDKYLVTSSFRIDGSSKFGINNRFGYFPSFALAWRIKNENFIKNLDKISDLKLRISWGEVGNQEISNYQSISTYTLGPDIILDEQTYPTSVPARLPNPNLKWETTRQTDIGMDFDLFNERLSGALDVYFKKTYNMLLDLPVPTSSGFTSILSNIGSMKNYGMEFTIDAKVVSNNKFNWESTFNFYTLNNKVINLGGINQIITGDAGQTSQIFLIKPGLPIYTFYGYKVIGIWQSNDDFTKTKDNVHPGDLKYLDKNNDGTVNSEDRVNLGNSFPKFTFGLNNTLSLNRFELSLFIEGSYGGKMLNNNLVDTYFPVQFRRNRYAKPYLNRWTTNNPSTKYPSFINPTSQGNKLVNSYTVEDASYTRLKYVSLSYTVKNINMYITLENLITVTKYSGYDPEINPNGDAYRRIDFNAYPLSRNVLLGVNIKF